MANFKLLTFTADNGQARVGIAVGDQVIDLVNAYEEYQAATNQVLELSATTAMEVIAQWDVACQALHRVADYYEGVDNAPKQAIVGTLENVELKAPLLYPNMIFGAGANYDDHLTEMAKKTGNKTKTVDKTKVQPYFFLKSPVHTVIGPNEPIKVPATSDQIDWEAELAVVIGKPGRNIKAADAMQHIAGYTILHDVSARDRRGRDDWPMWPIDFFTHKTFDSAAPMGPWIIPADQIDDPHNLAIKLWVNDDLEQNSRTSHLVFDIAEQIEYLSKLVTLQPGDVIATGTPSGVGFPRGKFLKAGDTVRIELEGIGSLQNPVIDGE